MSRFLEPSTWAGIAAIAQISPDAGDALANAITAIAGLIAVILRERTRG